MIVIARGGGSVEDLLPFSDEALVRAVAACRTPVVSAIGHETDTPLLDLVADVRASTPTDAAKRVVPDVAEELERVAQLRGAARRRGAPRCSTGSAALARAAQPARCWPTRPPAGRRGAEQVAALRERARRVLAPPAGPGRRQPRAHPGPGRWRCPRRRRCERGYAVVQRGRRHRRADRRPRSATGERAARPVRRRAS